MQQLQAERDALLKPLATVTGIVERRWVGEGENVETLSLDAARRAIEHAGLTPADIDAVIVATISNPKQTPSVSAIVADRVGANPAAAYDVNAACAGFAYAVAQADALILASATPHNGSRESFAELVRLLDPTAVKADGDLDAKRVEQLTIRRHRHSAEVAEEVGADWAERLEPDNRLIDASPQEDAVVDELVDTWLGPTLVAV